jgi:hypothetical protein
MIRSLSLCLLAAALAACSSKSEPAAAPKAPTVETHAAATAKPGTWEDWCDEHQVPESQCTRCNPGLVPAFKATKDWCEEHGLPESQCLKCNPALKITRPPKTAGN